MEHNMSQPISDILNGKHIFLRSQDITQGAQSAYTVLTLKLCVKVVRVA